MGQPTIKGSSKTKRGDVDVLRKAKLEPGQFKQKRVNKITQYLIEGANSQGDKRTKDYSEAAPDDLEEGEII